MIKKRSVVLKISSVFFVMYSCLMIWEVFLGPYRSYSGIRRYNLYPFKTIIYYFINSEKFNFNAIFINLVANIVTFIPLGFFVTMFFKKFNRMTTMAVFSVITIFIIEVTQFIFNVGVFDIDDIILNSLGCIIGLALFKWVRGIFEAYLD